MFRNFVNRYYLEFKSDQITEQVERNDYCLDQAYPTF